MYLPSIWYQFHVWYFRYDSPFGSTERSRKNDDFSSGWGSSNSGGGWGMDRFESKQDTYTESSKQDDRWLVFAHIWFAVVI